MKSINDMYKKNDIKINIERNDVKFLLVIDKTTKVTDEILSTFILKFYRYRLDISTKRETVDELNAILSDTNYIYLVSIPGSVKVVRVNNIIDNFTDDGDEQEEKKKPKSTVLNINTQTLNPKEADGGYMKGRYYYNWLVEAQKKKHKLTTIISILIDGKKVGEASVDQLMGKGYDYEDKHTNKSWHFDIFDLNSHNEKDDGNLRIKGKYAYFKYFNLTIWSSTNEYEDKSE